MLPPLGRDPRVAFELKDALHTAIFTGVAAGQVARSLDHAERHYGLPFLREERDLGGEDLIAPAALAGQWDRFLALGRQWRRGWEHAGRPSRSGAAWPRPRSRWCTGCAATRPPGPAGWASSPPSAVSPSTTPARLRLRRGLRGHGAADRGDARGLDLLAPPGPAAPHGGRGCGTSGSRRCGRAAVLAGVRARSGTSPT